MWAYRCQCCIDGGAAMACILYKSSCGPYVLYGCAGAPRWSTRDEEYTSGTLAHLWGACRVLVYWDGDAAHYPALIDDYDEKERYHLIYDDGSLARGCLLVSMLARVRARFAGGEDPFLDRRGWLSLLNRLRPALLPQTGGDSGRPGEAVRWCRRRCLTV